MKTIFSKTPKSRKLRMEHLEERTMLSVNPSAWDIWADIAAKYSDLNRTTANAYTDIEIAASSIAQTGDTYGPTLFDATPEAVELFQRINRMRKEPDEEFWRIFISIAPGQTPPVIANDTRIVTNLSQYYINLSQLLQMEEVFANFPPVAPLAWDNLLADFAFKHTSDMTSHGSLTWTDERLLEDRLKDFNFPVDSFNFEYGENVLGNGLDKIEDGYGSVASYIHEILAIANSASSSYRNNVMNPEFTRIGIGLEFVDEGTTGIGPWVATVDFVSHPSDPQPLPGAYLLGVAYDDMNGNKMYDAGEGLEGCTITVEGFDDNNTYVFYETSTSSAGAYQFYLPEGNYEMTISGTGFPVPIKKEDVLILAGKNVKEDFVAQNMPVERKSVEVTTLEDIVNEYDDKISLREAIQYANENVGMTITFDPSLFGETIVLDGELIIDKDIIIDASGMYITIDANMGSRVFTVENNTVEFIGLTITGGKATGSVTGTTEVDGGAIYVNSGIVTMTNCTITGNTAWRGAGIYNNSGTVVMENCEVSGNTAEWYGGGIGGNGDLFLTDCTIVGNSAGDHGGGIANSGTMKISNSEIAGNYALEGGGIYCDGPAAVTNCTIAGNYVEISGAGIYNFAGITTIHNTILAKNTTSHGAENVWTNDDNQVITEVAWSLIDNTMIYSIDGNVVGKTVTDLGNNLFYDPRFMEIPKTINANNTGENYVRDPLVWDLRLMDNSPAINRGDNAWAVDAKGNPLEFDLEGINNRILNGIVDMGAYESDYSLAILPELYLEVVGYDIEYETWTVAVLWTLPDGMTTAFLEWAEFPWNPWEPWNPMESFSTPETRYFIYDLLPWNTYYVRLRGIDGDGPDWIDAEVTMPDVPDVAPPLILDTLSILVTTLDDTVADDGKTSLREAIEYAGQYGLGTTIRFADSLIGGTIFLNGEELSINKDITIDATGMNITIDACQKSQVFNIANNTVALAGLNITHGKDINGAGIYNSGILTVIDCEISGNMASSSGGGIFSNNTLTLRNCKISDNTASSSGGGVYNFTDGIFTATDCIITGNTTTTVSSNSGGGGIFSLGKLTLTNCEISGNTTRNNGGGIHSGGIMTLTDCAVTGNSADGGGDGGGIYATSGQSSLTNCLISDNTTTRGSGGGIYCGGTMTLTNCSIMENTAFYRGGGINNGSILTLIDCDISGNRARIFGYYSGVGGGLHNEGTSTLTNCTIAGNTAEDSGGGIYGSSGELTLYNTIVVGNIGDDIDRYSGTNIIQGTHNLTTFTGWTVGSENNLPYNPTKPLFIDATNGDYRLAPNSQAINKGNNVLAETAGLILSPYTRDLAGNRRFVGASIDIGAYEFDASAFAGDLVVTTLCDWQTGVPHRSELSLREALLLANSGDVITFDAAMFRNGDGDMIAKTITLNPEYGELKITNNVSIVGMTLAAQNVDDADVALLIIDAGKNSRVMSIAAKTGDIDVVLENLTLTGGDASHDGVSQGGAMYVKNANLTLTDVAFTDNKADYGGAVFLMNSVVTMTGVTMTGNHARWGGAIYQTGGSLTINSSDLSNNSGQRGGAIYQSDGSLWLDNVMISDNASTWGGGLYLTGDKSVTTLNNTTFTGNDARQNFGKALVKAKDATLTVNGKTDPFDSALSLYLDENELMW